MVLRPRGGHRPSLNDRKSGPFAESVTPVHGYVRSFDNTRIFYSAEGRGAPLVFCYGLVCSSLHWTYQVEHFRKTHQAVWFDYRGHHRSDAPEKIESMTVENFAKDTLTVLDELKIEKAVILGHSMGVNVVLDFYRLYPERVAALVLANGTAKAPLETMFHSNAFQTAFSFLSRAYRIAPRWVETLWRLQSKSPLSKTMVTLGGFNPYLASPEDIELYIQQVSQMDPKIFIQLIENYAHYDATHWLHEVKVPTLIIGGEHDHLIPQDQQILMNQLIRGSQLEIIHHGSHCPQMDLPELVNLKISHFLEEVGFGKNLAPRTSVVSELNH